MLHTAVIALEEGRGDRAARLAESLLGHLLLQDPTPTREALEGAGIDPAHFRNEARALVLAAARTREQETWGSWSNRLKTTLDDTLRKLGGEGFQRRLGGAFRAFRGDRPGELRTTIIPRLFVNGIRTYFLTIHEAKGREFDGVLFYSPKPSGRGGIQTCPAKTWWSSDPESEEREVAFVAVTRAKVLLVVAVHELTYNALMNEHSRFVERFSATEGPSAPT